MTTPVLSLRKTSLVHERYVPRYKHNILVHAQSSLCPIKPYNGLPDMHEFYMMIISSADQAATINNDSWSWLFSTGFNQIHAWGHFGQMIVAARSQSLATLDFAFISIAYLLNLVTQNVLH